MSDKEKIRDKTQEEELDRKIAAIREKNAKIVQRRMEVDADAQASNGSTKPPPSNVKPTSQGTERSNNGVNGGAKRSGKHEWNREWDHGKTPAETWKENVPSMETIDRKPLSSRITRGGGVAARGGGGGRGAGGRGGGAATPPQKRDGQQSGSNRGPRNENQRSSRPGNFHDNRTNGERRITTDGKESFKIEIKNIDPNKKKQRDLRPKPENGQPRKPRQQRENSTESGKGKPSNNNDAKVRNRNPRSNDRRDVNIVVRMLVNKVVKTLRDEERAANGQENGNMKDEESDDKKESSPETSVDHGEEEERDDDAANEQKEEGEETIPTKTEPKEEAEVAVAEPAPVSA